MKKSIYIALSASLAALSATALVADTTPPTTASPVPTEPAEDVISIFSDAYTDVTVDTFRTSWSSAEYEEVSIEGTPTIRYTNLDFVGIETVASQIDATEMGTFHIDVWTPNMDVIRVKLVDFGPDGAFGGGDDTEHELAFTGLAQGEWHSLEIPLSNFSGLQNRANLAQFIISGTPTGAGTLFVDNIYFSVGGDDGEPGETPAEQPPTPGGFVANSDEVDWGQVFVAAGPNNVAEDDLEYRLFYSISADAPSDPTTASQYIFGSTTADGGGTGPFGFVIADLEPGTEYTFWLYQYNTATSTYSAPATATTTSGGEPGTANPPSTPDGLVASDAVGDDPVGSGEIFLAVGPNNTGDDIVYRLFYSTTATAPSDPTTANEYSFGATAGDGDGIAAFGFVLGGLNPGTEYTFWLYQYDNSSSLFSNNAATASAVSGGSNGNGNGNGGTPAPTAPATASPVPTEPADEVISIFSSVYSDVPVDTFRTGWSVAAFEEVMIEDVPTLRYSNLDFVGIETVASQIDASGMEYFHIDVWTPNMDVIRIKLVDFGPDGAWGGGDDTEHELVFEGLAQGEWHSLQIPLADFTNMLNQANLAQFILSGTPAGAGTLFVDNIYLSGSGEVTTPPTHFAGFPIDSKGNINTGDFLGPIHVSSAPWVYIFDLKRWVYMVDPGENFDGSWSYFAKPESSSQP
ncbi:MAG: hypothetical protein JJU20_04720 [Opitutales bacterium]|nr:hypothetical protein [Opitutales bacterium]